MKKNKSVVLCLTLCASMVLPALAQADTVLDFVVKEKQAEQAITQSMVVKDGQVMVKVAGGNRDVDLLYSRAAESVVIVDHRKRTLMTLDEQEVARLNQQAKDVQPLLQGFSDQVAKLSPEQRQKWQELLGESISLEKIAKASETLPPNKLVSTRISKKVAGVRCQEMRLMQGETPMAELCLAEPSALKIPAGDEATIRALFNLYERIASKTQGMARQLGLSLPTVAMAEMAGLPVEIKDLSRDENGGLVLSRVKTAAVSPEVMKIPSGYKAVPLALWP